MVVLAKESRIYATTIEIEPVLGRSAREEVWICIPKKNGFANVKERIETGKDRKSRWRSVLLYLFS